MGKDEDDDLEDIVYKGVIPTDSEHDSFFGSRPKKGDGTHYTTQEGQGFVISEDD